MTISIHQPNYLPWLGFFDKIKRSDKFVILDNVQYPRGKNHFGNRNKIKIHNNSKWLTIPVLGKSQKLNFNEIGFKNYDWAHEHLRLLKIFYKDTPYFEEYFHYINDLLLYDFKTISDLNIQLIKKLLRELDIETEIILSSSLVTNEISGADRIMTILQKLNATKYITGSGPGSIRYINEQDFNKNNIELIWQHYKHPEYNQVNGKFIPYMNILDLLFNEGPNSKNII
jgi:hypothetical protein|tara:strand:- start:1340 stop:2023 length:684 start_codon:yes stop_codon:yes gene_type:complete